MILQRTSRQKVGLPHSRSISSRLKTGANLPHYGRFNLVLTLFVNLLLSLPSLSFRLDLGGNRLDLEARESARKFGIEGKFVAGMNFLALC